ncbi:gamma-glutamyltransferase (plasmid) [Agrobacterium leguminum]|nr:gamma-glutamyltransferase [Agrobacterium leguminum]WLE01041.1 gamma-glutamyltransferase [Agrobacterium leguminum]
MRKPTKDTSNGIVAAQHRGAAEVGAEILRAGGDAVDAAVAVSYAIGVLEPWMSGPGGGGAMVIWRAKEQRAYVLNFGMKAPVELNPADYPLADTGHASDLFAWRSVVGDRNVTGASAVAVPGTVAGTAEAHSRFGRLPWSLLLQPAVDLAAAGLRVDWYASLMISSSAKDLAKDRDAAAIFLDEGKWPKIAGWTALSNLRLDQSRMAATLAEIRDNGATSFYEGRIAERLVTDVRDKGGCLSLDDLRKYRAEWQEPLVIEYRGSRVYATPTMTAGPSLKDALASMEANFTPEGVPDAACYLGFVRGLMLAYEKRLAGMGDNESPTNPACTTHFSVVDAEGNMVSMTQTLLSTFGSKVVSPSTGLLMNNGIMWFDPEPGRPNSLGPDKRCLMNVCPVIVDTVQGRVALGASGGRKILPAVAQLTSFICDYGMDLEAAFHQQRIDASGGDVVIVDETLHHGIIAALQEAFNVQTAPRSLFPYSFACPAAVSDFSGTRSGCTEIMTPWGDAVAE